MGRLVLELYSVTLYAQAAHMALSAGKQDDALENLEELRAMAREAMVDMRVPVMDGLEATRHIKNQWPGIRVIALSTYHIYRAEAHTAGADVFLLKGCTAEELQTAIVAPVERQALKPTTLVLGAKQGVGQAF